MITHAEERMCAGWPKRAYTVALSEDGRGIDSTAFSRWLARRWERGANIVFNIGGAYGFSRALKQRCDEVLSVSHLTLAHNVALLVLVEQLYRACTILKGPPYHKA